MIRIFFFLAGFGIAVAGGISTIAYLNLFATGTTMIEFFLFITTRVECYLLPLGVIVVASSLYIPQHENPIFRDLD
ncbi:hypothetical protein [Sutcliffiella halmapala]|uniref:hypothetical protein n=1 Tax=Sutcliffiella halmapala TaxID=79882 RepID=UPI0009957B70|nr:hypothetical protein [Sutcliffiella halmapala]